MTAGIKKILNIGVSPNNDDHLNRKIRISNLISVIAILFMLPFVPLSLALHMHPVSIINIGFLLISIFTFVLHSRKLHIPAFFLFAIYGVIYFTCNTLIYGLSSSMHFFLLIMCMIAIVMFDDSLTLKLFNGICIILFFILLVYMQDKPGFAELTPTMIKIQRVVNITNLFSLFSVTIIFFLFFKRDNTLFQKMLLQQKKLVQEKQDEIIDSITYAKRIQEAILPPQHYWQKNLPESFILYKPKDIVAGDFYWMEKSTDHNFIFFAVADCTGHGVPGAMVSVVCNNALNRSLLEFNLSDTGKILDKTRELVIETFGKSDNEVKDGMDISLCRLNVNTNELQWSGANNPLWLIQDEKLLEIKADKQPIGNHDLQKPFTAHSLNLKKGDLFYLFTDGYADQFGGPKGKKFKYKKLQEHLLTHSAEPVHTQKENLETLFYDWKNNLEQVDDVCIIGIKL